MPSNIVRVFTILVLIMETLVAESGSAEKVEFGIFRVSKTQGVSSTRFAFENVETKRKVEGFYDSAPLLSISSVSDVRISTRELGGSPLSGLSFRFIKNSHKQIDLPESGTSKENVLVIIDGAARAMINLVELRNIIEKRERLFVAIPIETLEEASALEDMERKLKREAKASK